MEIFFEFAIFAAGIAASFSDLAKKKTGVPRFAMTVAGFSIATVTDILYYCRVVSDLFRVIGAGTALVLLAVGMAKPCYREVVEIIETIKGTNKGAKK